MTIQPPNTKIGCKLISVSWKNCHPGQQTVLANCPSSIPRHHAAALHAGRGFRVSPPQLYHCASNKPACHACARSCARQRQHGAAPGPQPWQRSYLRIWLSLLSRFCFQEPYTVTRIIVHRPHIRQWFVSRFKILPAASESSQDIGARNIVPALFHTGSDAAQGQLRGGQPQKDNFDPIAGRLPSSNPADIG